MILESVVYFLNVIAITLIGVVIYMHYNAWRAAPRRLGILPLHVMMVSFAQVLFIVLGTDAALHHAQGSAFNWRVAIYFIGIFLTIGALIAVGEFQRRRRL